MPDFCNCNLYSNLLLFDILDASYHYSPLPCAATAHSGFQAVKSISLVWPWCKAVQKKHPSPNVYLQTFLSTLFMTAITLLCQMMTETRPAQPTHQGMTDWGWIFLLVVEGFAPDCITCMTFVNSLATTPCTECQFGRLGGFVPGKSTINL